MKTSEEYMRAAEAACSRALNSFAENKHDEAMFFTAMGETKATMAAAAANIECMKLQQEQLEWYKESVNHGSPSEETPVLTGYGELDKRLTAMDKRLTEVEWKLAQFAPTPIFSVKTATDMEKLKEALSKGPSSCHIPTVEVIPNAGYEPSAAFCGEVEYRRRWQELYSKEHPGQTDFVDGEPTEEMKAKVREIAEKLSKETFVCERCGKDTLRSDMKIAHFHMSDAEAYCVNIHQICSGCYGLFSRLAGRLFSGDEYKFLTSGWNFRNKVNHGSQDSE